MEDFDQRERQKKEEEGEKLVEVREEKRVKGKKGYGERIKLITLIRVRKKGGEAGKGRRGG